MEYTADGPNGLELSDEGFDLLFEIESKIPSEGDGSKWIKTQFAKYGEEVAQLLMEAHTATTVL